jgi:hypothetical protein
MHLVLALPPLAALAADRRASTPPHAPPHAPCLARLIVAAGAPARDPDGPDAMLAAHYGILHAPSADCPLAPVRLAALGIDPGTAFWLAADPVTLVAGRDDVRLTGVVGDLGANDAATLIAMLNAHFATDGIEFVAARPDAWFVRAPAPVALRTRPVAAVAGRMLRDLLPTGPDAGTWRRWQNEIQMLLYEHPVNNAREAEGKPPANSVWLYEGGVLAPPADAHGPIITFADDGIAVALARHAGRPARAVPEALDSVLSSADAAARTIVAVPGAAELERVEQAWTAPAWSALADGSLDAVTLVADDGDGALGWTARRPGLLRRFALRFAHHDLAALVGAARTDA